MSARLKKSQTFTGGSLEQDFALQLAVSHDSSSTVAPCGTLKSHSLWWSRCGASFWAHYGLEACQLICPPFSQFAISRTQALHLPWIPCLRSPSALSWWHRSMAKSVSPTTTWQAVSLTTSVTRAFYCPEGTQAASAMAELCSGLASHHIAKKVKTLGKWAESEQYFSIDCSHTLESRFVTLSLQRPFSSVLLDTINVDPSSWMLLACVVSFLSFWLLLLWLTSTLLKHVWPFQRSSIAGELRGCVSYLSFPFVFCSVCFFPLRSSGRAYSATR